MIGPQIAGIKQASVSDDAVLAAAQVLEMRKSAHVNLRTPAQVRGFER